MADRRVDHLLIGGGIAAATCAQTLRDEGAGGSILLVGRELDPPYHRPPCSKGYMQGRESKDDTFVDLPEDIEVLTRTSVLELDGAARTAKLSTTEEVEYGSALIATGAMVRRLNVEGAQLEGIHYLRALGNADAIRNDVADRERIVCVGGSYIGCEVAASLTALGKRCTIVMLEDEPMERGFGAQGGRYVRRVLEQHGIEIAGGVSVERFEGSGERVEAVVAADGRSFAADAVVCGTGALPDVMLAKKSGLELGELGGVRCDATLQTSADGLYAAGDICEYDSVIHGRVMRIEHEQVAMDQGATAARNMLGAGSPHDVVPYFWSDLSDWTTLEYVGPAHAWDEELLDGTPDDDEFSVRYMQEGRLVASPAVGGHADLDAAGAELRR